MMNGLASDPHVILRSSVAYLIAGISYAARLDQQQLHLSLCTGLVLDALWHHEHLAGPKVNGSVAQVDA